MSRSASCRDYVPWLLAVVLSLALAFAFVEGRRLYLESHYRDTLATQTGQRAIELTAQTMNGRAMGAVATLGLVNRRIKDDAKRETFASDAAVTEALGAVGEANQATGVFVVGADGVIRSSWAATGKPNSGLDIGFRSYFQMAMEGKPNVYAAIGTSRGMRSLYFAAPLYGELSANSPVIGATVARLPIDQINAVLESWPGPALLLSPQRISFASNREDWVASAAGQVSAARLAEIRELRQFGYAFEGGQPKTLPFDVDEETVRFDDRRYAVSREVVRWNDKYGDWTLVLLTDLDTIMPLPQRCLLGVSSAAVLLAVSLFWLVWRRRLARAEAQRLRAEAELRAHADRLASESTTKSLLARLSADLHRAESLSEFAEKFMLHVGPRANAEDGAFFMIDDESGVLRAVGRHGALGAELESMALGQGLIDRCAQAGTPIEASVAFADEALGSAQRQLLLSPVVTQRGSLRGVFVLASHSAIASEGRAFIEAALPMAAMNLEILERNLGTRRQAVALQRQQRHLKETEAWFRSIIEAAPDGMLVADQSGAIVLANPVLETMFGYGAGQLIGKDAGSLVPSLRDAMGIDRGGALAVTRAGQEGCGVRADSRQFPVDIGVSTLPALGGRGGCHCASIRDISERKRAEEALAQRMEELERFNRLTVGREEKMIELKNEINALLEQSARQKKYKIVV